ncbi:MAG: ATP-binding protein [Euryarchaeota archaeon]|nr:ATP-binding protein [Euryarchaeota archaeon]
MAIYENNLEHLLDELQRIHLMLSLNFKKRMAEQGECNNDFQGLCISENEVNTILQTPLYEIKTDILSNSELETIENLAGEIHGREIESLNNGKKLRLCVLSELFHLSPFERDALLISLAPELDIRYEKIYSYLQNDVTKKRPTVDLVIKLLSSSIEERFMAREYFSSIESLIKDRLVYLMGVGAEEQIPLLSKSIKVDERIIDFLLGINRIDPRIQNFSSILEPKRSFNDLILGENQITSLKEVVRRHSGLNKPLIFFFHGPYGTGKKMTAEAVCMELKKPLLIVDSKVLLKDDSIETLKLIIREALLQNSCVYIEGIDALWKEKGTGITPANMIRELDSFPDWVFLSGELSWEPAGVLKTHGFINIAFPIPAFSLRKKLWKSYLNGEDADIDALANKFKFSGGQIKDAIFTAHNVASAKSVSNLSMDELYHGCKAQSNRNLSVFARKIEPHYTWDDIVLPEDIEKQLKEISSYIKYRGVVFTDWGFDKKFSIGKGLTALFSGPSGTGKTMSAEIIARDSGLDLYKIDLSNVVSKYIGETEKNLSNIFKEAETSNAILFFDEADALFGKRSEVKDAHDRYANIEIGYLLQKMEEYEGVVILATNLSKNIDDAFLRRMQFVIEFPFPDEDQRKIIWTRIFPKSAPQAGDIDYEFFAERLKLAGGNIKNIALSSAFYAAEESCDIGMHHIMRAAMREHMKMGKPFLKEELEPYYKMIEGDEK